MTEIEARSPRHGVRNNVTKTRAQASRSQLTDRAIKEKAEFFGKIPLTPGFRGRFVSWLRQVDNWIEANRLSPVQVDVFFAGIKALLGDFQAYILIFLEDHLKLPKSYYQPVLKGWPGKIPPGLFDWLYWVRRPDVSRRFIQAIRKLFELSPEALEWLQKPPAGLYFDRETLSWLGLIREIKTGIPTPIPLTRKELASRIHYFSDRNMNHNYSTPLFAAIGEKFLTQTFGTRLPGKRTATPAGSFKQTHWRAAFAVADFLRDEGVRNWDSSADDLIAFLPDNWLQKWVFSAEENKLGLSPQARRRLRSRWRLVKKQIHTRSFVQRMQVTAKKLESRFIAVPKHTPFFDELSEAMQDEGLSFPNVNGQLSAKDFLAWHTDAAGFEAQFIPLEAFKKLVLTPAISRKLSAHSLRTYSFPRSISVKDYDR